MREGVRLSITGNLKPKQRQSLLVVLPSLEAGGAERVAVHLLKGIDKTVFDPALVVFQGGGALSGSLPENVPVIELGRPRLRDAIGPLVSLLRKRRPDLVFSTLGYVNLTLLALRWLLPISTRLVIREANTPSRSLEATPWRLAMVTAYRRLYRTADAVVCLSQNMRDELEFDIGVPRARLQLIFNPVDESWLRAMAKPYRDPGAGVRLVAVGRLVRQKGYDRLLPLLARCRADIQLTIIGNGPDRDILERAAADLGLQQRVRFLGFQAQPWPYLAGADAFVLPSRWEGMPNAALEALVCGTPVIATPEAGGINDVAPMAQQGAVTIASYGDEFTRAIEAVRPRGFLGEPATSLLPEQFRLANTVANYERVFLETLTRS